MINIKQPTITINTIKLTVWMFLLAELLDCITTIIGLRVGGIEGNILVYKIGWVGLILLKIAVCFIASYFIQRRIQHVWMEWLVVLAGFLVVPWNIYTIIYHLICQGV